ncbi:hypothetical protein RHSIM_Rhsim10G0207400 [Rhododendron simsii]|uniref:BZIP domain-containing protein n=1 Tax=Rhododendron simsii TaxID=118357 RepID=A0A834GB43_RHOSS|nr:hypothetical protein RHSIM_Rhsim10G0207400 [Rhododendron simsii]
MEEVWNDINLTSLHDHPHRHRHRRSAADNPTTLRGHNFLDFLSAKNPPPPPQQQQQQPPPLHGGYGSPPSPPSAVALRLNSGPDDNHQFSSILEGPLLGPISSASCFDVSLEGLASASSLPCLERKRCPESDQNPGERRHKRMIKNRESAARSRARKQACFVSLLIIHISQEGGRQSKGRVAGNYGCYAYTNELELEVANLMEENARLRRQQQEELDGSVGGTHRGPV